MHTPVGNVASSQPVLMRFLVRSWEYRRPRLWVGVRFACGIFNVVLGVASVTNPTPPANPVMDVTMNPGYQTTLA